MLPPLMCSLADMEHAEVRVQAIAFLHLSSLWHSLFSGVFLRGFFKCFIYLQNSIERIGNKIFILSAISIYFLYLYVFDKACKEKKILCFAYLLPFRKTSTYSTTVHHTPNSFSDKFLLSCLKLLRLELRSESEP